MSGLAKLGLFIVVTVLWWLVLPWLIWRAVPMELLELVRIGAVAAIGPLAVFFAAPVIAVLTVMLTSRLLRHASPG